MHSEYQYQKSCWNSGTHLDDKPKYYWVNIGVALQRQLTSEPFSVFVDRNYIPLKSIFLVPVSSRMGRIFLAIIQHYITLVCKIISGCLTQENREEEIVDSLVIPLKRLQVYHSNLYIIKSGFLFLLKNLQVEKPVIYFFSTQKTCLTKLFQSTHTSKDYIILMS